MATKLPQVQGGRVTIGGVPNVALPEVRFGQRDVSSAFREQAQYQKAMGDVIGRMSRTVFGAAEQMSQEAGLQFAAANPLTAEQLEAMSKGDMSQVDLGSPQNVFSSAVRKARAMEVSAHAEAEARQQMVELLQKADMGEIDADQAYDQINAITNGFGESIAQIDPDAAYKFRATAAGVGNRVLEKVAEIDGQKRMIANTVKVQRMYTNLQQEIALAATTKMPIDQETGQEISSAVYIDALKQNFLVNAQALIGVNAAAQYVNTIDDDINTSKVNAISQYLMADPTFANDPNAVLRLTRGDAGSASNAFATLLPEQQNQVIAAYMTADGQNYTLQRRRAEAESGNSKREFTDLYARWSFTDDPMASSELFSQMLDHPALTNSMVDTLKKDIEESSPEGLIFLEGMIRNGEITTEAQLWYQADRYGVGGKPLGKLFTKYRNLYATVDGSYVKRKIKQAANVPEGLVQIDPKSEYAKKIQQYEDEFIQAQIDASREGRSFSAKETVDRIAANAIAERQNADKQAAKRQLSTYEERIGGRTITMQNLEALRYQIQSGAEERLTKRDLSVIENLLKTIEGIE